MTQKPLLGGTLIKLIAAEGKTLHKTGTEQTQPCQSITVPAGQVAEWEEIDIADLSPYTAEQYKAKLTELIHERYDHDDEIGIMNNIREEPTEEHRAEYAEYQAFRAACKQAAKNPELYKTQEKENPIK